MYSGKKKCHTAKVQCIINHYKTTLQIDTSTTQMHDFKLFKQTNPNLTQAKFILADSGYQGIQNEFKNAFMPIKATKKYPLVQEAKDYNTLLSKTQVKADLREVGENGIPGGAVECADIRRNTGGEGGSLDLS